jgi:hypothetical protein
MSRAERRAYKRLTKSQDPYALPGGASAAARTRGARPRRRRNGEPGPFVFLSGRFLAWAIGGALVIALIGFSMAWPSGMPGALFVGLAAAAGWIVLAVGFRFLQRRLAQRQLPR